LRLCSNQQRTLSLLKSNMQLVINPDHTKKQGIYAVSARAKRSDIPLAARMVAYCDQSEEEWAAKYDIKAWAMAQAQLCESTRPLRIFVVHPSLLEGNPKNAKFPARAIFNPVILEAEKELITYKNVRKTVTNAKTGRREIHDRVPERCASPNIFEPEEGCMSFTHRKPKKVQRVFRMTVRYWYPRRILGFWVLWRVTEQIEGLKSQIFQHEIQHMEGENIFHAK